MIFDKHAEYGLFRVAPHNEECMGIADELYKQLREFVSRPYKNRIRKGFGSILINGKPETTVCATYKPVPRDP